MVIGVSQPKMRNLYSVAVSCVDWNQESRCVGSLFIWQDGVMVAYKVHALMIEFRLLFLHPNYILGNEVK